jgi:hypothetical protein
MVKDYVESNDLELAAQLKRFYEALVIHGPSLGFSEEEIREAGDDAAAFDYIRDLHFYLKHMMKAVTHMKARIRTGENPTIPTVPSLNISQEQPKMVPEGIVNRFRQRAAKAKASNAYTRQMGIKLGILAGNVSEPDMGTVRPQIKGLRITGSGVQLQWKKGVFDGIKIYRKINKGEFEFAGFDIRPHFSDPRPLPKVPETWTYQIQYFKGSSDVGQFSDPSSIHVATDT